jgi:hypothetical protein
MLLVLRPEVFFMTIESPAREHDSRRMAALEGFACYLAEPTGAPGLEAG